MLDWGADGQYTDGGPKMNETPASSKGRTGNQHLLLASALGSLCSSTGTAGYHSAFDANIVYSKLTVQIYQVIALPLQA